MPCQSLTLAEPMLWEAVSRYARRGRKAVVLPSVVIGLSIAVVLSNSNWLPCFHGAGGQHVAVQDPTISMSSHLHSMTSPLSRLQPIPFARKNSQPLSAASSALPSVLSAASGLDRHPLLALVSRKKAKEAKGYTALSAATQEGGMASGEVGFIGVGIMGRGMALNLLKAGRSLLVWNRDVKKAEELAKEFPGKVTVTSSVAEVVQKSTLIYSMLSTLEASEAVFPSVLEALTEGKMIVDCATLTPERMAFMAGATTAKKAKFLEAPVSGSKGPAEQGQLIFLTAGDEDVKKASEGDLEIMGKKTFYFGTDVGKGSRMKMVVNMIMGAQLNAYAEGVALAEAFGLPANDLYECLKLGAMNSPMVQLKGPAMMEQKYPAAFPLKHAQKDMRFALQMGDEVGLSLPVAAASNEQYKKARAMGWGDADFAAVAEASRLEGKKNS